MTEERTDAIRKFYQSRFYPLLVALLVLLGNVTGYDAVFGAVMILSLLPGFLLMHDLNFAITPFLTAVFTVTAKGYAPATSDYGYYLEPLPLTFLIVAGVSLIGGLSYFAIRNRRTVNPISRKGLLLSTVVFCTAICFNGAFNPRYTVGNLLFAMTLVVSILGFYLLFSAYLRFDRTSEPYFFYCLVVAGMLILTELIVAYFTVVRFEGGEIVKESVVLGWGVWTSIGGMLVFLMPACFWYAATGHRGWIGFLLGLLMYFGTFLSQSRGALLIGSGILVLCLAVLCCSGANRKQNRIYTAILAVCGIAGVLLLRERILPLVQNFLEYGFGDNGRFDLWRAGIRHFRDYPVFGSGFYDSYVSEWNMVVYPYLYHDTPVQLLGACGAVGLGAYLFHRFCTVRLVFRKPNPEKTFLGLCVLGLLTVSLIDVLFFKTYPTFFYALMLVFMEHSGGEGQENLNIE